MGTSLFKESGMFHRRLGALRFLFVFVLVIVAIV